MKKLLSLFAIVCFIAIAAAAINAQDDDDGTSGVAYSKYDKAKNQTTFEVQRLQINDPGGPEIILNASYTFDGTKLSSKPDDVIFIVQIGSSDRFKHPDMIQMKLKIDGKAAPDVMMLNLDKRMAGKVFLETIGTRMKYSIFKAMAGAKTVEMKLDNTSFTVDSAILAKFADLDKMLNP